MKKQHLISIIAGIALLIIVPTIYTSLKVSKLGNPVLGGTTKIKLTDTNAVTPAATSTPTASMIPIASSTGRLEDGWQNISYDNATLLTGSGTTSLHLHNPFVFIPAATSSNNLLTSNDAEQSGVDASYTLSKTTRVLLGGYYRVYFEVKGNANGPGYGRIYRNGSAVGTERSANLSYVAYAEDILFLPGDNVEIYRKGDGDSTAYIQNFRLYGTLQVTSTLGYNF